MNQTQTDTTQTHHPLYKNSRQRFALLNLLKSTKSHPTAAWLYDRLKGEFPNLSHGTVYRNLSILSDQGLVHILHSGSTFDRFDADTTTHYHVTCETCGQVEDIAIEPETKQESEAEKVSGYRISSHRLDFFGICPDCQKSGT
jgi:Fur family peroxide stress response transcriptional regulator